ncbi:hypothetical protein POM88_026573 [Heracleum sosnowskyi]|uniref:Uncharacterized protein n=1 Tax=Heracleum sosnowskyi TaxID=360622 RepID=A0AAD8I7E8_9APIA|nr:hypothetical protein POM88_026573 [Heracleum sosnowskyi]
MVGTRIAAFALSLDPGAYAEAGAWSMPPLYPRTTPCLGKCQPITIDIIYVQIKPNPARPVYPGFIKPPPPPSDLVYTGYIKTPPPSDSSRKTWIANVYKP